ncbi:MAG: antitoxin [Actinomycetota bacterium]|nr:antitoxin [Actinomycetota bacterium]
MKTAISVPDQIFDRASDRAKTLGLSRSEFFARAADNYLDQLDAQSVARQIDAALERLGAVDDSFAAAVAVAHQVLADTEDEW